MNADHRARLGAWLPFMGVLLVYAALVAPLVARLGISWDEQVDLGIARAYLSGAEGWLTGSSEDPSQARLLMLLPAVTWALTGRSDLLLARSVTVLLGAVTLLGVYVYGRRWLDSRRALLATGLLATSPLFLTFSRVAFTESDVGLAGALAWLLVAAARLRDRCTVGRTAVTGLVLGLAISTKFTAVAALPALWLDLAWTARKERGEGAPDGRRYRLWIWTTWACLAAVAGWGIASVTGADAYRGWRALHVALVVAAWATPLLAAARHRRAVVSRRSAALFVGALALLTSLVIPPEHLTNPLIVRSLFTRAQEEMSAELTGPTEAAGLHALALLVLSSPGIGAGLWVGVLAGLLGLGRPEIRGPALLFGVYFAGLLALPVAQTFYMVALLPAATLLASDGFFRLWSAHRRAALTAALVAGGVLALDLARAYPDLHLTAYPWVGRRTIAGRPSIGYRSVVHTPSDGVEQALRWLERHRGPEDRVLAYMDEWHILAARGEAAARGVEDGFRRSLASRPAFVLIHVNARLDLEDGRRAFADPGDRAILEQEYEKAFALVRSFGIEVASVWRRR
jgi:hypothetical protein